MRKYIIFAILFLEIFAFSNYNNTYYLIELIKPFKTIKNITIYTENGKYKANIYSQIVKKSDLYFNNEKVEKIEIDADYFEEKNREIWISWEGMEEIKEFLDNYKKLNNVDIKVLNVPKISSKLIPQSKTNLKLPDVIMASAFDYPTYKELNIVKGDIYNYYYDTQVVYVNKKYADMIKNWDLEEIEKILKETGKKMAINPISAYWFSTFLMGYGKIPLIGKFFELDDNITKNAMTKIKSWYKDGFFDLLNKQAQIAQFTNEEAIFLFQGTFLYPTLKKLLSDKFIVKPLPKPLIPFKDYKVFITTKDGDEAFTKWLVLLLNSPNLKETLSKKYYKFFDNETYGEPIPFDLKYVNFHKNVMDILKLVLLDKLEINQATKKLEEIVNE
ncbi:hypothetical protein SU69_00890 [Thermosipho melanesiensis]|uniref:Extracellular solute-binding protein, family 1 n=2 Tax=Thermosipho melanesiensis TaxID=46541 RepID=A6LJE2_THEM4|nr:hypothetical protein [Thermosipho melanesiensis]ABR30043.1 hypothetical protein Tmel_0166 [Thermosipho melanesiensis BI429]APT73244.1 hypothetical protein BW47_00915 [Thermosipho melanesiensis]OOC38637.1 hypothetical protein SU68_00890 [Thermosipho melanesiensis]OOC40441.1 hypothetical protein SU70_00890 [Thermosipho melanesiensis]OOC40706.1 hypothetical protein SU69_00890 [Thermosipho melanesiensis]